MIMVNAWNEPRSMIEKFVEDNQLVYTILTNGESVFKDIYRGKYVPATYLIDREGEIVYTHLGWSEGDREKLEHKIQKLLKH